MDIQTTSGASDGQGVEALVPKATAESASRSKERTAFLIFCSVTNVQHEKWEAEGRIR